MSGSHIQTPRLHGARFRPGDLPYLLEMDGDPAIQLPIFGRTFTPEESAARLQRWLTAGEERGMGFFIFSDAAGARVGHAGLFVSRMNESDAEIGYALKPEYWNKGYATEIARALLRYAFNTLRLPRVVAVTRSANTASRRVMEKCGMLLEMEFAADEVPLVRYAIAPPSSLRRA
jgi:ribosomal-protein-alanine N-acetyltransferase